MRILLVLAVAITMNQAFAMNSSPEEYCWFTSGRLKKLYKKTFKSMYEEFNLLSKYNRECEKGTEHSFCLILEKRKNRESEKNLKLLKEIEHFKSMLRGLCQSQ